MRIGCRQKVVGKRWWDRDRADRRSKNQTNVSRIWRYFPPLQEYVQLEERQGQAADDDDG